jgi:hypothetical protein
LLGGPDEVLDELALRGEASVVIFGEDIRDELNDVAGLHFDLFGMGGFIIAVDGSDADNIRMRCGRRAQCGYGQKTEERPGSPSIGITDWICEHLEDSL